MYTMRVKSHFDAAHLLPHYGGKCRRLHGHRWEVEVVLESNKLNKDGFVVDFAIVKDLIEQVIPDHKPLNAGQYIFSLLSMFPEYEAELTMVASVLGNWLSDPTAERIAEAIYMGMQKEVDLQELNVNLTEVTVWESPNCSVTYRPDSLPIFCDSGDYYSKFGHIPIVFEKDRVIVEPVKGDKIENP